MNTKNTHTSIMWFRNDLRTSDNPALIKAATHGSVMPVYILDDENIRPRGAASKVWLHHSLTALNARLEGALNIFLGNPKDIFDDLLNAHDISAIHWNRAYAPDEIKRDTALKDWLKSRGIEAESHNGALLWEPWQIKNKQGEPYKVFTPFYRKGCLNAPEPREPLKAPQNVDFKQTPSSHTIDSLNLLPSVPAAQPWHKEMLPHWTIGEEGAHNRLQDFIDDGLNGYKQGRNCPAQNNVSRLSPYLQFGEISPHQVWHAARALEPSADTGHFCSELGWREFSYYLLYHFPHIETENFNAKFDAYPWKWGDDAPDRLNAWQRGQTGYPIVDAGLRELWQTGYMHNRVRMIVASFLIKNLGIHWHEGEKWFWDTLFDADRANNVASWQWVAGSGADAAPYFRIFNPISQAEKFDPDGTYIKTYVPELQNMEPPHIFAPFDAPPEVLKKAGIQLGETYPKPIVDLKTSRQNALDGYDAVKNASET